MGTMYTRGRGKAWGRGGEGGWKENALVAKRARSLEPRARKRGWRSLFLDRRGHAERGGSRAGRRSRAREEGPHEVREVRVGVAIEMTVIPAACDRDFVALRQAEDRAEGR